jgi:hypothetical protein
MMTSNLSSSSGQMTDARICGWEEDNPVAGSVLGVAPPTATASAMEAPSKVRTPARRAGAGQPCCHHSPLSH